MTKKIKLINKKKKYKKDYFGALKGLGKFTKNDRLKDRI